MPGPCRDCLPGSGPAFSREKKKTGSFFAGKNFTARANRTFFLKIRIAPKVHAERKFCQSDVHPIIG
jgi:hypothetical protein